MEQSLNQYHIFYVTAQSGNLSRAAQKLYISQPAVSRAVSKLEEDLKVRLFIRNSRGVSLTTEGRLLFDQLKTAFDAIETGEERLRRMHTLGIGHLKIGASATFCKYLLLPYLKGFIQKHPHIRISIECQSSSHTLKLLEEGKIDAALIVHPEGGKNIDFFPLGELQDIFVASPAYLENLNRRENPAGLSLKKSQAQFFGNANIMLLDEENISRLHVDNHFRKNSIEVNQVLEVTNMDLLIEFARIGLGVACVIREFVTGDLESGRLTEIPLSTPISKRSAGFAHMKSAPLSDAVKSFVRYYTSDGTD